MIIYLPEALGELQILQSTNKIWYFVSCTLQRKIQQMSWRIWPWVTAVWSHYFPCPRIRIRKQAQLRAAYMQNSLLECICVCEWILFTGAHRASRLREDVLSEALQRGPDNLNWGPHVYWVIETEQCGYEFSVPVNQSAQGMESLTACGLTNVIPKLQNQQHVIHRI